MNATIYQSKSQEEGQTQPFCSKKFEAEGARVINTFLCRQPHFTSSDLWKVQKQRSQIRVR
jgi:hypothetical protein